MPITTDADRQYFGGDRHSSDRWASSRVRARFGKSYASEPDELAEALAKDAAVREADTLLLTVLNMLGIEYNSPAAEEITRHVAAAIGWTTTGGDHGLAAGVRR